MEKNALPIALRVSQHDQNGMVYTTFRATAKTSDAAGIAAALKGISFMIPRKKLESIGRGPVTIHDERGTVRITIEVESISI